MCRNRSKRSTRTQRENRRTRLLLPLVILLAVLTVCASCKTPEQTPDQDRREILAALLPEMPVLPEWPDLDWQYIDGWYCLSESGVDRVLDYWENKIPNYKFELEKYQKKLTVIITAM